MLLFHSKHCEHSKMLIMLIKNTEIADSLKMVCVDTRSPILKNYNITEVPTIIYENKKYEGDQAFQLVEKVASSSLSPKESSSSIPTKEGEDVLANVQHFNAEFDGFSDNFSTFGEEKPNPLERSFSFLQSDKASNMIPESKVKESNKKDIASDYERLIKQRSEIKPK